MQTLQANQILAPLTVLGSTRGLLILPLPQKLSSKKALLSGLFFALISNTYRNVTHCYCSQTLNFGKLAIESY